MITLGRALLLLALALAVGGAAASIYGARTRRPEWVAVGRRSAYALVGVLTLAFALLEAAFLRSDFALQVVAGHSSTTTPLFYRATAAWSSQEGSLLLWVWLLSLWSSAVLRSSHARLRELAPYATAVLLGFAAFFGSMLVFLANPFQLLDPAPADGSGLQPLLRHPAMMVHPPLLYSGYTLLTVPFAFGVAALVTRRLDAAWIAATRRFALAAWLCLGAGILLGARWSWSELGWGGYWAWDPVENAALMPWLTCTAFIHSVMVQQRRGLLKTWNMSLVLGSGILAVLGTFLVRSGILDSIHAFGASTLGKPFLAFVAALAFGSVLLVASRRAELRSEGRDWSLVSRESVFLLNNLVLVGLCLVILWGTFFPLISEAATGDKASVGPPWFDRYTAPLAILAVALSGLGPLLAWRRSSAEGARRALLRPLAASVAVVAVVAAAVPAAAGSPRTLLLFGAAALAIAAVAQELWRGAAARRRVSGEGPARAVVSLVRRNRRRYGGYLVHAGVAVMLVGVAASSAFQHVRDVRLSPGQDARVGSYDVRYVSATGAVGKEKVSLGAVLDVRRDGRHVATLRPNRGYYPSRDPGLGPAGRWFDGEAASEVGLWVRPQGDVWTAVQPDIQSMQRMIDGIDRRFPLADAASERFILQAIADRYRMLPPAASFRLIVSPLVEWVWIGGALAVLGGLISLWPRPRSLRVRSAAWAAAGRLGRALERA
ncbi:MAG TPA: cytochrome c-type biogenesis CcmF C-terminal domain-containing protein [Thermoleophilaceae bacterium]